MVKVLRGVVEQPVSVFDGFVNLLCGDTVNLFRVCLKRAYSDKLVKYPVELTHISGEGTTSVSWRSDREVDNESGPFTSKARARGKTPGNRGGGIGCDRR